VTILRTAPAAGPAAEQAKPSILDRQRAILRDLARLVAERAAAEAEITRVWPEKAAEADREFHERRKALEARFEGNKAAALHEDSTRRRSITDASIAGDASAKDEFAKASRKLASDFDAVRESARSEYTRSKSRVAVEYDSGEKAAAARYSTARKPIDDAFRLIESRKARLGDLFEDYRHFGLPEAPTAPTTSRGSRKTEDPLEKVFDRLQKLEPNLAMLEGLIIPKAMKGKRFLWIFVILLLVLIFPSLYILGPVSGLAVAFGVAGVGGYLLKLQLYKLSRTQVGKFYYPLMQAMIDAESLVQEARATADEQLKTERQKVATLRDEAMQKAKQKQSTTITNGENDRDERLRVINEVYAKRKVETQTKLAREMREAVDLHDKKMIEIPALHEAAVQKLDGKYHALKEKLRNHHESAWQEMAAQWLEGMAQARAATDAIDREVAIYAPRWDDSSWPDRPFPKVVPPLFRLGETVVDLARLPGGFPADARLSEGIDPRFTFPAVLPFPDRTNLLIEAPNSARAAALGMLQAAMFRLLTSLPPGQVRFTIVDPIGIGRNFGAFMHLADFDESLVSGQILTEPRQIEDRLVELSAHMEKVTQKYLRNEYATIDEYNAVAGEVAEPYRVLVVADFPTAFDEKTAARLAGIASGGTPCGVITLIARDLDRPVPLGTTAEDFRTPSTTLGWNGSGLNWSEPEFSQYPLVLDVPPAGEFATRLIQKSGAAARDAKRVEVPFDFIAPAAEAWWKLDSRTGIDLPLGKSGATKRQHLTLGKGTSQHVLVAGRTGSGKSTLLHALIVNVALNYSPDEVELYLIDFKKGVEFKVYATYNLPHAAVVAIESEREFGISVLQKLDAEMRDRADRFRDAGVQDLNGYRNTPGTPPCPRILLIVDEFQEFFVEEDKLAQEAALLLDRLVRQGRAFGVHVNLGSQSLGGAYALARTTLGQMAVRIALQCSESDAHLILSEQNSAAKLLSRPGEAIYNDANGSVEGNHFFQVVWLSDERREDYLKRLQTLAIERKPITNRVPIVFEGDSEADPSLNEALRKLLDTPSWPRSPRSSQAWLGDPVAIKEPTAVLFRRQGGNHLLIVGQNAEGALGIMASTLIGLAAQYPPSKSETVRDGARFVVIDGTPEDDIHADFLAKVAGSLAHNIQVVGWKEAPRVVAELGEEVVRRQQPDSDDGPELFLLIHDLGRFRDLRRKENDFGFGTPGEAAIPADHLAAILKEGSALGVHLVTWADTLTNLNRVFDNQSIREFESRVLFQISPTDSAHLLDSPAASKLGPNRAYFASEEQNRLEKFRPYGLPTDEWLMTIRQRLATRGDLLGGYSGS
jgi:DNA segregation ATPase FtsK/SpoIIIE, S-DNA-T family